jgi:hypothetical protein
MWNKAVNREPAKPAAVRPAEARQAGKSLTAVRVKGGHKILLCQKKAHNIA